MKLILSAAKTTAILAIFISLMSPELAYANMGAKPVTGGNGHTYNYGFSILVTGLQQGGKRVPGAWCTCTMNLYDGKTQIKLSASEKETYKCKDPAGTAPSSQKFSFNCTNMSQADRDAKCDALGPTCVSTYMSANGITVVPTPDPTPSTNTDGKNKPEKGGKKTGSSSGTSGMNISGTPVETDFEL